MISMICCSLIEDTRGKLFRRQVGDVLLAARVLKVEIAGDKAAVTIIFQHVLNLDLPRPLVFFALVPPGNAVGEFLELDGLGLGVVLPAFGQRLFVVPDFLCRSTPVEEQQIGRNAGVGREHAAREPYNRVQIELFEQFLLDSSADAVAEQRAVGHNHAAPAGLMAGDGPPQFAHDELKEK